jgi:hypothetical protein
MLLQLYPSQARNLVEVKPYSRTPVVEMHSATINISLYQGYYNIGFVV